ncbi:hypothetical protein RB195_020040 [Necator americanus]|uniref:Uncharacterized protein n=1 Tax=Necator americanus TaxID=51031 RepID=A0ABR1CHX2_NECAM
MRTCELSRKTRAVFRAQQEEQNQGSGEGDQESITMLILLTSYPTSLLKDQRRCRIIKFDSKMKFGAVVCSHYKSKDRCEQFKPPKDQ